MNISCLWSAMPRRGWGKIWVWLALLPGLVACASLEHALTPPEEKAAEAPVVPQPAAPSPAPADTNAGDVAALTPAPHPPSRPPAPRLPPFDPQALKGLDQEQALSLFGRPNEISEAPPATVWRYAGKGCMLDLFFYMDMGTHSFHVLTYEFQPADRPVALQRACLNRLREASRAH